MAGRRIGCVDLSDRGARTAPCGLSSSCGRSRRSAALCPRRAAARRAPPAPATAADRAPAARCRGNGGCRPSGSTAAAAPPRRARRRRAPIRDVTRPDAHGEWQTAARCPGGSALGRLVDAVRGRHHDRRRDQRPRAPRQAGRLGDLNECERRDEALADLVGPAHDGVRGGGRRAPRRGVRRAGERVVRACRRCITATGQPTVPRRPSAEPGDPLDEKLEEPAGFEVDADVRVRVPAVRCQRSTTVLPRQRSDSSSISTLPGASSRCPAGSREPRPRHRGSARPPSRTSRGGRP